MERTFIHDREIRAKVFGRSRGNGRALQDIEDLRMLNCKFNDTVHKYQYNKAEETQKEEGK